MPNQTKTIGATGDYSTIAAWEAASDVSTGWWKGEIIDAAEFTENVTFSGPTGTPTIANYVWLTAASGVRHSGKVGTGHARMKSGAGGHIITISEQYVVIEYLQVQQDSTGISDEAIRVASGAEHAVISRCLLYTTNTVADQDGVYAGDWSADFHVDNCIVHGFARAGLHAQNYQGTGTQVWNIDSCTIANCGSVSEEESGGINATEVNTSNSTTINVYNTGCFDTLGGYDDFSDTNSAGGSPATWVGTNNACSDTSLTNVGLTTGAQESLVLTPTTKASGSYFVVKNITAGSEDFQLLDSAAGNLAYGNAVDRVGSEPNSRQDFSLDIVGNVRSTTSPAPDIGASEYTVSGTSSVSSLSDLRWDTISQIAGLSSVRWNVLNSVNNNVQIVWNSLETASNNIDTRWDAAELVNSTMQAAWDIVSSLSSVSNTTETRWNLFSEISNKSEIRWDLFTLIANTLQTQWDTRNVVSGNSSLNWNIYSEINNTMKIIYDVLSEASSTSDIRWNSLSEVNNNMQAVWDIISSLTAVSSLSETRWNTDSQVSGIMEIRWNLLSKISNSLDSRWDVLKELGVSTEMRWGILQEVAQQLSTKWDVFEEVPGTLDVRWNSAGVIGNTVSLKWDVQTLSGVLPIEVIMIPAEGRMVSMSAAGRIIKLH